MVVKVDCSAYSFYLQKKKWTALKGILLLISGIRFPYIAWSVRYHVDSLLDLKGRTY
jgi:hypothetical protein